ncbi:hypothetical protein [Stakelama tenebrarum]|uniref:Uncharacterized protein n=1 Tax=Stakelama tenebrarum TaxID=2711215 RepID=A0A6G6Y599_9SPHN|nr:hypothetical protein [Sphingosinithalassobacter tenebrarum]QIG79977.1 hypothetical protein G5C33_09445 [Sphingosinithalassobacter tenebrarum]
MTTIETNAKLAYDNAVSARGQYFSAIDYSGQTRESLEVEAAWFVDGGKGRAREDLTDAEAQIVDALEATITHIARIIWATPGYIASTKSS